MECYCLILSRENSEKIRALLSGTRVCDPPSIPSNSDSGNSEKIRVLDLLSDKNRGPSDHQFHYH